MVFCSTIVKDPVSGWNELKNHLWYLSEDLVGLSFFDDQVPTAVKIQMVHAIRERESQSTFTKRLVMDKTKLAFFQDKDISHFVPKESLVSLEKFLPPDQ